MKKFISIIIAILVLAVAAYRYLGWFTTLQVVEKEMWPYLIVYEEVTGPYTKVGLTMNKIHADLEALWVEQTHGIGLYLDDPAITPEDELRSEVGSVVTSIDIASIEDYKVKTVGAGMKLVVEFPYKNMWSYFIGPKKAYPVLAEYMLENGYDMDVGGAAIELYDVAEGKIYFMMDIQ